MTPPTERIVVGVDGSAHSASALRWATDVGAQRGWPVTAVTAWALLDQRHPGGESRFDPEYGADDARAALAAYVEEAVGPERAAEIELRAVNDLPAPGLVEAAGPHDLLVVGARGRGGFGALLLGSVSSACLHQARGPVAVIRTGVEQPGEPSGRRRVVAGIDGSAESHRALRWAAEHAAAVGATLEVVHAWRTPVMAATVGYVPVDRRVFESAAEDVLAQAVATVADVALVEPPAASLVEDRATPALLARAAGAELVVVGARGLGGFAGLLLGSVSDQLTRHAPCPVVVVRDEDG